MFKLKKRFGLRSVDAAWSKVEFCAEYGCDRWMQRGAMSSFAPSTVRECTFVHDQTGTGARLEIARDAPPQFEQLSQKMGQ